MNPLIEASTPPARGLTDAEVQQRRSAGKTNALPDGGTQSVSDIVKKNVFTYFNLIFAIIAVLLIVPARSRTCRFCRS